MKTKTQYFIDVDGWEDVEIPFPIEENTVISKTVGNKFYVGALCHDDNAGNPFEEFDEGEFFQFDNRYKNDIDRPDPEDFKTIIRKNPGRIVLVSGDANTGKWWADGEALTVKDTKGKDARCYDIENADGYYIAPEDVTNPTEYAKGSVSQYSAWCQGQCYVVCIFEYDIEGDKLEYISDDSVWGFYGIESAEEELKRMIDNI